MCSVFNRRRQTSAAATQPPVSPLIQGHLAEDDAPSPDVVSACVVETLGRCKIALRPVELDAEYANTDPAVAKKADCPIRFCCVDARSVGRFAGIFRARAAVCTVHGREDTHPVHVVARVIGAFVAVVAHDAFTKVLSAHAGCTDARNAVPVAGSSIGSPDSRPPVTGTSIAKAMTRIAFVPAVLTAPAFRLRVAAPNEWHHPQRADT